MKKHKGWKEKTNHKMKKKLPYLQLSDSILEETAIQRD